MLLKGIAILIIAVLSFSGGRVMEYHQTTDIRAEHKKLKSLETHVDDIAFKLAALPIKAMKIK